jgi:hypothetical protein
MMELLIPRQTGVGFFFALVAEGSTEGGCRQGQRPSALLAVFPQFDSIMPDDEICGCDISQQCLCSSEDE